MNGENSRLKIQNTVDGMRDEIVKFAQELFRFPSITYTPAEKTVVEFCAKKMREVGLKVEMSEGEKDRPNAVAKLTDERGGIGFNSHLDVVPIEPREAWISDPFSAEIRDGKIYARGSCDCKGGMVCAIMAVKAMAKAGIKLKGNLQIAAVIDDELEGVQGMGHVLKQSGMYTPTIAIQGDPANGLDTYTAAHKSNVRMEIRTEGKQFHAGSAHKGGLNAILKMGTVLKAINDQLPRRLAPGTHKLFPEGPTIAAGTTIKGGIDPWVVPSSCTATVVGGVIPYLHTKEDVRNGVESIIRELQAQDPQLKAEITQLEFLTGDDVPESEEVVKVIKTAAKQVIGIEPRPWGVPFCGMSTYLNNYSKIPTIVYGCGSTEFNNTHAPNEWIYVEDLMKITKVYCAAAMNYLGFESK